MGLFSSIAGIIGGNAQKKASRKAEAAQLQYLQQALDYTKATDARTQGQLAPYLSAGTGALDQINALLGISTPTHTTTDWAAYVNGNPDALANWNAVKGTKSDTFGGDIARFGEYHYAKDGSRRDLAPYSTTTGGEVDQQGAIDALKGSPLYTSLYRNGEDALLSAASATGGLRGGNTQGALANFGADTLANVIQQQLSNLGGIAGMGQNAVNSAGSFGAGTASSVSNLLGNQGQVRAGGLLTRGGISAAQIGALGGIGDQIASAVAGGGGIGSMVGSLFPKAKVV